MAVSSLILGFVLLVVGADKFARLFYGGQPKKQWIGRKIGIGMLITYIGYTCYIIM